MSTNPGAGRAAVPSESDLQLTIVICTLGKPTIGRVLQRLEHQTAPPGSFEVLVVADAAVESLDWLEATIAGRSYDVRLQQARRTGASAARNLGVESAATPLLLFIGDDNLPEPQLVAEHLAWHREHPAAEIGVLGHVRWADELRVTPFMRWLEHGVQFDYPNISGTEAGWARFYTANASVKRSLVALVGGFREHELPFLYEDLDLALRMRDHGFRLLYNRRAVAEHLHDTDLERWKQRAAAIAVAERSFVALHPDFEPYFHDLFESAAARPQVSELGARLARVVPLKTPVLGPLVWSRADLFYRQSLAGPFLQAWHSSSAGGNRRLPATARPG